MLSQELAMNRDSKQDERLDPEEIAKANPGVDLDLIRKAQKEMREFGIEPAAYDLRSAFARRSWQSN